MGTDEGGDIGAGGATGFGANAGAGTGDGPGLPGVACGGAICPLGAVAIEAFSIVAAGAFLAFFLVGCSTNLPDLTKAFNKF